MQFGPHACARSPRQQAYGFAAVAERQHEQPRATILAILRVAHHGATALVDLRFFSGCGEDDARCFWTLRSAQLANKTLHRLIAIGKTVIGNQVLPDGHGIPATSQSLLDELAMRFADARRHLGGWWPGVSGRPARVGGHLYGRFCR